jgi:tetratricopeptide (TPR) repeat protein
MSTMCTEPGIFEVDAYWKSQGFTSADQVRQEVLWQAAGSGETPIHTGKCPYCSELLESFRRMRSVVDAEESVAVAVCPDAAAFSAYYYGEKNPALAAHLKACSACREDLAFLARSQQPREKALPASRKLLWLAAAAAALVFTLIPWPWLKRPEKPAHIYQGSSQFASLAQVPPIDRAELLAESPADHHSRIERVLAVYEKGDYKQAEQFADIMVRAVDDPSAGYLLAMAQYKQGKTKEAFESMRAAEATLPRSAFRCWGALQFALMLGDKETIRQELNHAGGHAEYHDRCDLIRQQLKI